MMAGASPAAVQRILRHRDPRLTTEVYGHLAPDFLRAEIDRLRFAPDGVHDTSAPRTHEADRAGRCPGAPQRIRTSDLRLRRPSLYPAELVAL